MYLEWVWKKFAEIDGLEMYDMLSIRQNIFNIEQHSLYQDADGLDKNSLHLIGYKNIFRDNNKHEKKIIAYARIVCSKIDHGELVVGRLLVIPNYRAQGVGRLLLRKCLDKCREQSKIVKGEIVKGKIVIKISAQTQLRDFYSEFGFKTVGQIYDDAGVAHVDMILSMGL